MQHEGLLKIMHECTLYLLDQPKYMNFFYIFNLLNQMASKFR